MEIKINKKILSINGHRIKRLQGNFHLIDSNHAAENQLKPLFFNTKKQALVFLAAAKDCVPADEYYCATEYSDGWWVCKWVCEGYDSSIDFNQHSTPFVVNIQQKATFEVDWKKTEIADQCRP